jgi:hypothetical protein
VLVETWLRKGLGLEAHRVEVVREDGDMTVVEIERVGRRRWQRRLRECRDAHGGRRPPRRRLDLQLRRPVARAAFQTYRGRCGVFGARPAGDRLRSSRDEQ